jgi:uncharacterized protein YndB with AHSA1/START domain
MSVKTDLPGRRTVHAETEVPGTPEDVWKAIATAEGISSWFVPTRVETNADGTPSKMVMHFGPGLDVTAPITAWDPPRSFSAKSEIAAGGPAMATEWTVEARSGGTCLVRVVHSLFASTDDWDDQLEGTESGWPGFFKILRLALTHFRGQPSASFYLMSMSTQAESDAWTSFVNAVGFADASTGSRVTTAANAPQLAGVVEERGSGKHPNTILLRVEAPAPGVVSMWACTMGGMVALGIQSYFYGAQAAAAAAQAQPLWEEWLQRKFPAPGPVTPAVAS